MTPAPSCAHVLIKGRVQGVGFRYFVQAKATLRGLTGWVRNLPSGDVETEAEGPRLELEGWIEDLRQGPSMSRVEDVQVDWRPMAGGFTDFSIR